MKKTVKAPEGYTFKNGKTTKKIFKKSISINEVEMGKVYLLKWTGNECVQIIRAKGCSFEYTSCVGVTNTDGKPSKQFSLDREKNADNCIITPANIKQKAKLVAAEIKNGYFWDGRELLKI